MRALPKNIWLLVLFFFASSCAIRTSTNVKKLTQNFIEIEADIDKVWLGCFEINPKDRLSLMMFYIKDGTTTHEFFYRRLFETKECKSHLKDYQRLTEEIDRITVVGITAKYDPEDTTERIGDVPEKFSTGQKRLANGTFIRLQTQKGCKAYFENHCRPENYWGGLTPPE